MPAAKSKRSETTKVCELVKLKYQQKYLESSPIHLSELSVEDMVCITEINSLQAQLKDQICEFKENLRNEVDKISSTISSFKNIMTNPLQYNTKEHRDQLLFIDQTLHSVIETNFKRLNFLKKEFCELETNVVPEYFSLNDTVKMCPNNRVSQMGRIDKRMEKDDIDDIKKFDDFLVLNNNGHTGGWNDEEHFLFLKLKTKYKENIDQIVMSMKHIIGGT